MYLVFDIGGTRMRIASSVDGSNLARIRSIPTPALFEEGVAAFHRIGTELVGNAQVQAAAGGVAGPLDHDKTMVFNSNTPDWDGRPLRAAFESVIHAPVYLENDAALGGLGEAVFGAGKGHAIVAYLTVGSAIGGARIVDGEIDRNAHGFEPGYQIVAPDSDFDVSGWAIERRYGMKPAEITDSSVWEKLAQQFAYYINNTLVHWSPDILVLGGSMILGRPGIPIASLRSNVHRIFKAFPSQPDLVEALLGDNSGLFGAMSHLRHQQ